MNNYDTIIIGAGPAGLTAAIYLLRASKKVLIIEKESIGGQISSSPLVENYPGFIKISGSELSNNLFEQVTNLNGEFTIEEVKKITKDKKVITDETTYQAKSIIIATGCKHRRLNIENEEDLIGNGVHFCVSCDGAFYKDKTVVVVGGGNSAIINALSLSDICKKVYIIQNLDYLTAEKKLIEQLDNKNNIEIILSSILTKYHTSNEELTKVTIKTKEEEKEIKTDGVFLSIGLIPANEIFKNIITLDKYGYIESENMKTNIEGIFVAGDCRTKSVRQVTTATSDGTIAAINTITYLNNKA